MIISVTLNPAVDQTLWVRRLVPGEVNRPHLAQLDPAGKGINASRMVHRLGHPTLALGFLAGDTGHIVEAALTKERVQSHFVRVPGQTRVNVTVIDETSGASTSLFAPGPPVDAAALAELEAMLATWLPVCRVLVLAGSLPPGIPSDVYARFTRAARERGVRVIIDAEGDPLRLGLEAGPDVIKPNRAEAEALLGRPLGEPSAALAGARELAKRGARAVVLSLGADGALCVEGDRAWRVRAPRVERRSTVGSGDSLVAGLAVALAEGNGLVEGLRLGTAAGAATAASAGTALGTMADLSALLEGVKIEAVA
jgi:1-phosphofructokinase family hexose kinase